MTSQHDKPNRWRPRFSIRTLVIVVTLVCLYAACWGPTKTRGVGDVEERAEQADQIANATAVLPLVVVDDEMEMLGVVDRNTEFTRFTDFGPPRECYYFWFFGYVAKLPYERTPILGCGTKG